MKDGKIESFDELMNIAEAREKEAVSKPAFSDLLGLREDIVEEIAKEREDVESSKGYSDTYAAGIKEGLRLALVIFDATVAKREKQT